MPSGGAGGEGGLPSVLNRTLYNKPAVDLLLSGYLSNATATLTYQTLAGMADYQTTAGMSLYLTDAPADGSQYARKDNAWAVVTGGGGGGGSGGTDVQVFGSAVSSGSFTWTKPANAKLVEVFLVGGGGSGGTGSRQPTTVARVGGSGGGSGGVLIARINPEYLGATETVVVGAGGASRAGNAVNSTSGLAGNAGGNTTFSSFKAAGGVQGYQGTGTGGNNFGGYYSSLYGFSYQNPSSGSTSVSTGSTPTNLNGGFFFATGGGSGGGANPNITTASSGGSGGSSTINTSYSGWNVTRAGGSGGTNPSIAPTAGFSATNQYFILGTGGGGSGYLTNAVGQNAANGGWPAGGGGGSAGVDNNFLGGASGAGANGIAIITTYF